MSRFLDKEYKLAEQSGVSAYRVVVYGKNDGECGLPHCENQGSIAGVTIHSQQQPEGNVAVRKLGIARVEAAEPIRYGEEVVIAGKDGRIKSSRDMNGKINRVGFAETSASAAGDVIEVFLSFN